MTKDIIHAVERLKMGELVAFPTERLFMVLAETPTIHAVKKKYLV